jgi:ABC-type transporter Mla MlaB component
VSGCHVKLDGDLTDGVEASLSRLLKVLVGPKVRLSCAGIRRINSVGVVQWRQFVEAAQKSVALEFEKLSVPFLGYVTLLPAFVGRGSILSLHLPHTCRACKKSAELLVDMADLKRDQMVPPVVCPGCGTSMVVDLDLDDLLQDLGWA